MGKTRPIKLETRDFDKAGDAAKFFSDMLNRYYIGDIVSPVDAIELMALLKRHDEFDEKVGSGIDHFEVAAAPDGHDGRCFWIVRTDRTRIDFSFKHCLRAIPSDK